VDFQDILKDLGYTLIDKGNYWQTSALYRGGDNETALQIYKNTGAWIDYVDTGYFLPFQSLIEKTLKTKDEKIISKYLKTGKRVKGLGEDFTYKKSDKLYMPKTYKQDYLDTLLKHYKFYNDRGISNETLDNFHCGFETSGNMYQRFVFPIINEDGEVYGLSGRLMIEDDKKPKWKQTEGKSGWIYPYYTLGLKSESETAKAIRETSEVILVESIGDLLSFYEHGIKNVLVIFGVSVSSKLSSFLVQLGVKKIILSLNNDNKKEVNIGMENCIKAYLRLLNIFDGDQLLISLPLRNDFGDMRTSELFEQWRNKTNKLDPAAQRKYILKYIECMKNRTKNKLVESLYKNRKYIINE